MTGSTLQPSSRWAIPLIACAALCGALLGPHPLRAQQPALPAPPLAPTPAPSLNPSIPSSPSALPAGGVAEALGREVRAITAACGKAVCRIEATDELGAVRGTGFFIEADGTLLTSFGVGGETQDLVVTIGEERYPAVRVAADARSGLAVLKIEIDVPEPMPFLKLGRSIDLVASSPVLALGYPMEFDLSPSFGFVAGFDLGFKGRLFATRHLRANLAVQRGQGGSPILNMGGEVVGVLISTVEGNSGIFALPVEAVRKVLHDLRMHGRLRPGWLGADLTTDPPLEGSTARLSGLRRDGPSDKGGLKSGDVLLQIGPWKITNAEDVLNAAFYLTADEPVSIRALRDGTIIELKIMPEDPPAGVLPTVERKGAFVPVTPESLTLGPSEPER